MPWGRYPERVKPFRKWAADKVDKADINDRATGGRRTGSRGSRTRRKIRRRKTQD